MSAIALDLILVGVAIVCFGFLLALLSSMIPAPPMWLTDLIAKLLMAGFLSMIVGFVLNIMGEQ